MVRTKVPSESKLNANNDEDLFPNSDKDHKLLAINVGYLFMDNVGPDIY